jgi:Lon protease-like protein
MKIQDLPSLLPMYASEGTILLPRAQLPLVFHEKEGRSLIDSALKNPSRLIGVVQPTPDGGHFQMGCAGRIINFQETTQFFIMLGGLCRFKVEEVLEEDFIKMVRVNYEGYEKDMEDFSLDPFVNRPRLLGLLKDYLEDQDIIANWEEIDHASDELIISSLTMACPFEPIEKQALLETSSLSERCDMMIAFMERANPHLKAKPLMLH